MVILGGCLWLYWGVVYGYIGGLFMIILGGGGCLWLYWGVVYDYIGGLFMIILGGCL